MSSTFRALLTAVAIAALPALAGGATGLGSSYAWTKTPTSGDPGVDKAASAALKSLPAAK